ncbi:MAG: hypothetical protein Q4E59_06650, partial [Bacteroidales bacterium]|nr:hypothetical protein [Bacteroidales bacterium]
LSPELFEISPEVLEKYHRDIFQKLCWGIKKHLEKVRGLVMRCVISFSKPVRRKVCCLYSNG